MVPKTDAALAAWSTNFNARCAAQPELFALTVEQMAQYSLLHEAFIARFNAVRAEGARCKALVAAKEQVKESLLYEARQLYGLVKSSGDVSHENKALAGVTLDKTPATHVPPPALAPLLTILSVTGRRVRCKLSDASAPNVRRRPINAAGAMILSHVGATPPPTDGRGWKIEMQTGKPMFTIEFPSTVGAGMTCWIIARWYNRRGEYSPASAPMQTYLQVGPIAVPTPAPLRAAA